MLNSVNVLYSVVVTRDTGSTSAVLLQWVPVRGVSSRNLNPAEKVRMFVHTSQPFAREAVCSRDVLPSVTCYTTRKENESISEGSTQ